MAPEPTPESSSGQSPSGPAPADPRPPDRPLPAETDPPLDTAPLPPSALPSSPGRHRGGRNLPLAIASGVMLALVFVGTLLVNDYAFLTFVAVLVVIGLLELGVAFRERGVRPVMPVVIGAGLIVFYGAYAFGPGAQVVGLVLLLFAATTWVITDPRRESVAARLGATLLMTLWVPFTTSFIGLLLARDDGQWYVAAAVGLCVTADIGAYAFGSQFGRHKLAASVSPAKTWEGTAGALLTVLVFAGLVTARVVPGLDAPRALVLGAVIVAAATLGDLSESLVKRDLGVKDLGTILPGHGGIMDRVDAIIFALPAAHLALLALGV